MSGRHAGGAGCLRAASARCPWRARAPDRGGADRESRPASTRVRRGGAAVFAMAAAWAIAFAALCAGKLRGFLYRDFDLALFAQAVDGVRHGRFDSSIRGMPWLADHSSFIL